MDFDFFDWFLFVYWEQEACLKLRIGFFSTFTFFFFLLWSFLILLIEWWLPVLLQLIVFWRKFFVVNVLRLISDKCNSMFCPILFYFLSFLVSLRMYNFNFIRIFRASSLTSLICLKLLTAHFFLLNLWY